MGSKSAKNSIRVMIALIAALLSAVSVLLGEDGGGKKSIPQTLILNGSRLAQAKAAILDSSSYQKGVLAHLLTRADHCLKEGPWSVVHKNTSPPSGDKHDYMSVGPYWWPNPDTADGLPYIRKDGETNPLWKSYDNYGLDRTSQNSLTLALAWYYSEDDRYAVHAVKLLRTWFIDPETRMNPHLEYGQAVPGRSTGRKYGIIETEVICRAIDAALILNLSEAFHNDDAASLRKWISDYLLWLQNSKHASGAKKCHNNHSTWYDVQLACFSLYTGQINLAKQVLSNAENRISAQIEADGAQPHELDRARGWDYSVYNLRGFFALAALGERVGVDLWKYRSENGSSIENALDWLVGYIVGRDKWKYKQIKKVNISGVAELIYRAPYIYEKPLYKKVLREILTPAKIKRSIFQLEYPLCPDYARAILKE